MRLVVQTLAERPDLGRAGWRTLDAAWPAFMHLAPTGVLYYGAVGPGAVSHGAVSHGAVSCGIPAFAEHMLLGVLDTDRDVVVARAATVPFRLGTGQDGEPTPLPDDGSDEVVRWAATDVITGQRPDAVASLEVVVRQDLRRRGLGAQLITAMKNNARRLGITTFVSPVRPVEKHRRPHTSMAEYVSWIRADGLPADPWLRAHARLGGRIVGNAPASTVIALPLAAWRRATGLPFDRSGAVVVPGALLPVHCSVEHDHAVYVEPAVWMRHEL